MEPETTPLDASDTIQPGQSPKYRHGVTILAMALFVVASLSVVAFLYYQNQQLKKMLAGYQTPVASPTPVATLDPTMNWKTYSFSKLGFSFRLPPDWTLISTRDIATASVEEKIENDSDPAGQYYMDKVISGPNFWLGPKIVLEKYKIPQDAQNLAMLSNIINGYFAYSGFINADPKLVIVDKKNIELRESGSIKEISIPMSSKSVEKFYLVFSAENKENFETLDQILSTFKFLGPTGSPSATPAGY